MGHAGSIAMRLPALMQFRETLLERLKEADSVGGDGQMFDKTFDVIGR